MVCLLLENQCLKKKKVVFTLKLYLFNLNESSLHTLVSVTIISPPSDRVKFSF